MYRVAKKTTKNTRGHCLKCKYCRVIRKTIIGESIVECMAKDRCIVTEFNANHFYCVQVKGFGDMSSGERYNIEEHIRRQGIKRR